jgi:hypothetical protein
MIKALKEVPLVVAGKRATTWYLALVAFSRRCNQIQAKQGLPGLVKYLKTCKLLLMQSLAMPSRKLSGQIVGKHAISLTGGGLPRLIPIVHRKAIRKGDTMYIQFWMTLFSLYKVFDLKPEFKLHTIFRKGKPESELEATGLLHGMEDFRRILFSKSRTLAEGSSESDLNRVAAPKWFFEPLPILMKITPNTLKGEIAFFNAIRDAKVWAKHPLLPLLGAFCREVENLVPWAKTKGTTNGSYVEAYNMLLKMGEGELLSIGGKRVMAHCLEKEMVNTPDPMEILDSHTKRGGNLPLNSVLMDFMTQIAEADLSKGNLDPTRLWASLASPALNVDSNHPVTGLYDEVIT